MVFSCSDNKTSDVSAADFSITGLKIVLFLFKKHKHVKTLWAK